MDNKNRVFHKETGAVCPLISDSYLLKTERGNVRFPYILFSEVQKKSEAIKAHGEWVDEHKPKKAAVPETEVIVKDEGEFTLYESIKHCNSRASMEQIIEDNDIKVDMDLPFRKKRAAILKSMEEA